MYRSLSVLLAASMAFIGTAQTPPKLKVGDQAPPIKVSKWVKGQPVAKFEKGHVYVVEFWATWCGPCKVSIPHLTTLAKQFKGKVTFAGISVWERGNDIPGMVDKFVKDMGEKMDYNVALDETAKTMATTWMTAAGQNGIPAAFVVGKTGKIEWIGHPMAELDKVLTAVLADKFDAKAAAAAREAQEARQAKLNALLKPVNDLYGKQDLKGAIAELDKVIAANPDIEKDIAQGKMTLMMQAGDEAGMFAYAKKLGEGIYKDDAQALNSFAWMLVDDKTPLKTRDLDVVIALATRAVDLTKGEDPTILDTLAYAFFKKGAVAKAIDLQQKAVDLASKAGDKYPQSMKDEMAKRLAEFKAKKG